MKTLTMYELEKKLQKFGKCRIVSADQVPIRGISYELVFNHVRITYMPTQIILYNSSDTVMINNIYEIKAEELINEEIILILVEIKSDEKGHKNRVKILAEK